MDYETGDALTWEDREYGVFIPTREQIKAQTAAVKAKRLEEFRLSRTRPERRNSSAIYERLIDTSGMPEVRQPDTA